MGWFWADSTSRLSLPRSCPPNQTTPPSCPMRSSQSSPPRIDMVECPIKPASSSSPSPESCPYPPHPSKSPPSHTSPVLSRLNPLNYMPLFTSNMPSAQQSQPLPLSREISTIRKADGSLWEYPSPQQMYNAMLRKGYVDTEIDAVEPMVAVHNFLNEGAWQEILEWERRFGRGLAHSWRSCRTGEQGSVFGANSSREDETGWPQGEGKQPEPQLVRFMGRPGEMTPKTRMVQMAAYMFPAYFSQAPPFDRHDWIVKRSLPPFPSTTTPSSDLRSTEVRYVIDYYSGPDEDSDTPVFFLDVRPALDSPSTVAARIMRWGGDAWYRGTGVVVREEKKALSKAASGDR